MISTLAAITTVLATAATPALARNDARFDYAKVTNVTPIYKTIEHRRPERQCWVETVSYERPRDGYRSNTGTIVGGIIGAAIGNELGHKKRNKQVGAVAGAVLGASIGRDISNRKSNRGSITEFRDEERCEVRHTVEYEEKVIGYDITYRYHGMTYHTRMDRDPGRRLKVAVKVRPVY
ncbi:glycine zipper 2TM domain-containing protein [Exilibacterium tricleocarpae]|uniref:Glycine zipper 2TM domain-containing protein n=2 Tax=Exilibacterium tricleocarpae TaxID=2591008 RepID=A0A545STM3_9GAMM|nr:glycine zipper 2TM domain-containing protein [Exilibacterium tricleocarpae]